MKCVLQINNETLIQNYKERSTDELLELHTAGVLADMACEMLENQLRSLKNRYQKKRGIVVLERIKLLFSKAFKQNRPA